MGLEQGSVLHIAYKLRQNHHPEYGGLELEIADLAPAGSLNSLPGPL
jgi:single-stranded-DNA-specific exonuclease